jgi:hypothetical protein
MVPCVADSANGQHDSLDDELRTDALDVLRNVLKWRLAGRRWDAVEEAVAAMASALACRDLRAFRAAVYDLELSGPTRAVPFPNDPGVEPPPPVIEEVNELIYTLDGRQAPSKEE